jgi:5-formyltetrahydrofolate cyclo-ligase
VRSLAEDKRALRVGARRRRMEAHRTAPSAATEAAERFAAAFQVAPGERVAGYWPVGDELDPRPLLARLEAAGAAIALPQVAGNAAPLVFRRWSIAGGEVPPAGAHGIPAPGDEAPAIEPDILLVPLLAFDRAGWRLGSGLGYYDRTLAALRRRRAVRAVGFAYAGQEVAAVPHGEGDEVLDWIVTEREVIAAAKERKA